MIRSTRVALVVQGQAVVGMVKFAVDETGEYGGSRYTKSPSWAWSSTRSKSRTSSSTPRSAAEQARSWGGLQMAGLT